MHGTDPSGHSGLRLTSLKSGRRAKGLLRGAAILDAYEHVAANFIITVSGDEMVIVLYCTGAHATLLAG